MIQLWNTTNTQGTFASQLMDTNAAPDIHNEEPLAANESQPSFAIAAIVIIATILIFFLAIYALGIP